MLFNTFIATIFLAASTSFAAPINSPQELIVFNPPIISPKASSAWAMGSDQVVRWGKSMLTPISHPWPSLCHFQTSLKFLSPELTRPVSFCLDIWETAVRTSILVRTIKPSIVFEQILITQWSTPTCYRFPYQTGLHQCSHAEGHWCKRWLLHRS